MTWWEEMHRHTFSYQLRGAGMTTSGGPVWGALQTGACRHVRDVDTVRSIDDEEVLITDRFETSVLLTKGTRVWRPGDATTDENALTVKTVTRASDLLDTTQILTLAEAG